MTEVEKDDLGKQLTAIQRQGYSYAENETHLGIRDVAVLIGHGSGRTVAALAVTSLMTSRSEAMPERGVLQALTSCAKRIGVSLGLYGDDAIVTD